MQVNQNELTAWQIFRFEIFYNCNRAANDCIKSWHLHIPTKKKKNVPICEARNTMRPIISAFDM